MRFLRLHLHKRHGKHQPLPKINEIQLTYLVTHIIAIDQDKIKPLFYFCIKNILFKPKFTPTLTFFFPLISFFRALFKFFC